MLRISLSRLITVLPKGHRTAAAKSSRAPSQDRWMIRVRRGMDLSNGRFIIIYPAMFIWTVKRSASLFRTCSMLFFCSVTC